MTQPTPQAGPGRLRAYDRDAALAAALAVFWRKGYEAASLDDLTAAMGLSRSSFYGCFGSKRGALAAAVADYSDRGMAELRAIAAAETDPAAAVRAVVRRIAQPHGDARGCFMANCITELAPHDAEVAGLSRGHVEKIVALLAGLLDASHGDRAAATARALAALAFGATLLRKAGLPPEPLEEALNEAERLLAPPDPA